MSDDQPAEQLRAAVAARAEGSPYRVVPTENGFNLRIDLADTRWHSVLGAGGITRVVQHEVVLDEEKRTMALIEDHLRVQWSAGAGPTDGKVPTLAMAGRVDRTRGRTFSVQKQVVWAVDGTTVQRKVDFTFTAAEGRHLIRSVGRELGWTEKMGTEVRIAIGAASVGGVLAVMGVALAIADATGNL